MIQQFYSEYIFKRIVITIQNDSCMIIAKLSIRAKIWKTTKFSSMNYGGKKLWYIQRTEYFYLVFDVQSLGCVQFFATPWSRLGLPALHYVWSLLSSVQFSSVAQSCPTLQPHGLQHTSPPCPSPTPGVYSNSCPLSR